MQPAEASVSQNDDESRRLAVPCPNCHKKIDHLTQWVTHKPDPTQEAVVLSEGGELEMDHELTQELGDIDMSPDEAREAYECPECGKRILAGDDYDRAADYLAGRLVPCPDFWEEDNGQTLYCDLDLRGEEEHTTNSLGELGHRCGSIYWWAPASDYPEATTTTDAALGCTSA